MTEAVVTTTNMTRWRTALLTITALAVLLLLAQAQLALDMVDIWWRSKTFNHCLVIPLISGWLIYERRRDVQTLLPQPSLLGIALLALAALLLLFSELAGVAALGHFALVLSLQALVLAVLGKEITRRLLFPLLYLWFAVPFGEFLVPQLQDVTADMAVWLLRLFDIPVFRDGHFIALPNGDFLVEEACSGINYLIASLALGTLYAYLQYRSYYRRSAFILLSIIVPIVANGIRAFGIILTAHLTNNEYAVGVDHLIYGWIFFGVVMFLLFLLGRSFTDGGPLAAGSAPAPAAGRARPLLLVAVPALMLALIPAVLTQRSSPPGAAQFPLPELPTWQQQNGDNLGVSLVGAEQRFVLVQSDMQIIAGYFPQEKRGSELVNTNHKFYNNVRWRRLQADNRPLLNVEASGLRLGSALGESVLVHGVYVFADNIYGPGWQAKWHQLQARLQQRPAPALYLLVVRPSQLSDAAVEQRLADLLPALQQALRQSGGSAP